MTTLTHSLHPPPRLLIVENNLAMLELLPPALSQNIPGIVMDVSSSLDVAVPKLSRSHYDIVVANAGLTGVGNFFLLRQLRTLHPLMPFIVTAKVEDHQTARQAIDQGAFDVIVAPLKARDASSSVELAHRFHELRMMIALRQKKLDLLRDEHLLANDSPGTFVKTTTTTVQDRYLSRQDTLRAYEQTINALERSLKLLMNQAIDLEHQAVEGAATRLSGLLELARLAERNGYRTDSYSKGQ